MTGLHFSVLLHSAKQVVNATARRLGLSKYVRPESAAFQASTGHESDQLSGAVTGKVGKVSDDAIPSAESCIVHLQLLELFVELRDQVEAWATRSRMSADGVWHDFVKLAVARFTHWFRTAPRPVIEMELSVPPLDVLMAWHSFMLNPNAYRAFCEAARSDDAGLKGISWSRLQCSESISQLSGQAAEAAEAVGLHPDLLALMGLPYASKRSLIDVLPSRCVALETDTKLQALLETYNELSATGFAYKSYGLDFDLVGAVVRQASFALKMSRFGWYHSPFRDSTLQRARERYHRFFALIPALPAGTSAVPTLDIDLVWHTHQLSPAKYAEFSRTVTNGRLVNHDDAIAEEDARCGSKNTGIVYREQFGDVYSICLSWYCEAARLAPGGRLSNEDVARVKQALLREHRPRGRKPDLASCRCHEVAAMWAGAGAFGLTAAADCIAPHASCSGGCGAPNASCNGGCGGCGSCGGCGG